MKSRIYEGWVRHRRETPRAHEFRYRLFMAYLDLDELDEVFRGRWLWSTRRPALARFRRADHVGDPRSDLADTIRRLVRDQTGNRPMGPIRLLTHLRYYGYCMNPVSFYYCWNEADSDVETIVAEVHNTPWGECHCYVLPLGADRQHRFAKAFHVSPFMDMDQEYRWRLSRPGGTLAVNMQSFAAARRLFTATMCLRERSIDARQLARVLLVYPGMTMKVIGAIYWQALRLWWKGTPFHVHPKHLKAQEAKS